MFQPTHPHGVRQVGFGAPLILGEFQPTHPHGVRLPPSILSYHALHCSNPRTRTGCDNRFLIAGQSGTGSNPRTRTGCDMPIMLRITVIKCSNPRTRTGCDVLLSIHI